MSAVTDWRKILRHPFSAEYPDLKGRPWDDMLSNMKRYGYHGPGIVLFEGMILDGWQRRRACFETDTEPNFVEYDGDDPRSFVEQANEHRRHEDPEAMHKRAEARRERVVAKREKGHSIRSIAKSEGVSRNTVNRDLGAQGGSGEPLAPPQITPEEIKKLQQNMLNAKEKVDGGMSVKKAARIFSVPESSLRFFLKRTAEPKPRSGPTGRKSGAGKSEGKGKSKPTGGEVVDHQADFKHHYGKMVGILQEMGQACGKPEPLPLAGARRNMNELMENFKQFHKIFKDK